MSDPVFDQMQRAAEKTAVISAALVAVGARLNQDPATEIAFVAPGDPPELVRLEPITDGPYRGFYEAVRADRSRPHP